MTQEILRAYTGGMNIPALMRVFDLTYAELTSIIKTHPKEAT